MELKMELSQKQILSQHMVQSMEILQMSAQELEGYIEKLALENPVIELAETSPIKADTQQEDLQRKLDWLESTDLQNRVYYQQERSDENMEANWHDSRQSEENLEEYLPMPKSMVPYDDKNTFALEIRGESMIKAGILNGDKIIVRQTQVAENGDIIVAMIENEATCKRFFKEKDRIRLQPENDLMEPMYFDNVQILGKVIGLIRNY